MDKTKISLTKTCASCGIEKPLSAFLQLSGDRGAIYGNICASCRKSHMGKQTPEDERTRSKTGVQVDSKSRVHEEKSKKQLKHDIDEQYHEERDENEELQVKASLKAEGTVKQDKEHQKTRLEKQSLFDTFRQAKPETSDAVAGTIEHAAKESRFDSKDTYAAKTKQSSFAHLAMKARLGLSSPVVSAAERAAALAKQEAEKDSPIDYIRKNWKK